MRGSEPVKGYRLSFRQARISNRQTERHILLINELRIDQCDDNSSLPLNLIDS